MTGAVGLVRSFFPQVTMMVLGQTNIRPVSSPSIISQLQAIISLIDFWVITSSVEQAFIRNIKG